MKEIPRTKKLEVAQYYLLGYGYKDIEEKTGVSHGTVVNIVKEIETGKLDIPGAPFDQVNDLHQLSLDLKKKGLSTSQAFNGLLFFERCNALGIKPEILDQWAALTGKFTDAAFPQDDFLQAAIKLYQLEKTEGKSFEILGEEYEKAKDHLGQLTAEVDSLMVKKQQYLNEIKPLGLQVEKLNKERVDVEIQLKALAKRSQELKPDIAEKEAERASLVKAIKALKQRRTKVSSEVDGKEDSLTRLNDVGFLDEDLLRVRAILERIAKDSGVGQKEVKEKFFMALSAFKGVTELENRRAAETALLKDLTKGKSVLTGEIVGLESRRDILKGEIKESASSVVSEITDTGGKAAKALKQQAEDIKGQFDSLLAQALSAAKAVNNMDALVQEGEESKKRLTSFVTEVRNKLEVR